MQNNSTPESSVVATSASSSLKSPKSSTIEFLRQFARCYTHEDCVQEGLGDLVLN